MDNLADIGLIGLAVMGQNLALNINDNGFRVAVFNRTTSKVTRFLNNEAKGTDIIGTYSPEEFVKSIKRPRKLILMIQAGAAVDKSITQLAPLLDDGDIIIDGGNSNFNDSIRRTREVEAMGQYFIGAGVSGGEEGARYGPSIMPGGSVDAWESVKPILQAVAAKVPDGTPCCDWVGEDGAGHFVKMVHNGIEYGDMQLICEAYHLMSQVLSMNELEISAVFSGWNKGILESFLIEITGKILAHLDEDGQPLIRKILDVASQKGTGKWTAITALEEGTPLTLIGEAVFARCLSAIKEQRVAASAVLPGPQAEFKGDCLFMDLDIVVTGSLDCFFDYMPGKRCIIHNWTQRHLLFKRRPDVGNSSIFRWRAHTMQFAVDKFYAEREWALANFRPPQAYLTYALGEKYWWPEVWVQSFKRHSVPLFPLNLMMMPHRPKDARILVFHGRPDPDQAIQGYRPRRLHRRTKPAPWIAHYWGDDSVR